MIFLAWMALILTSVEAAPASRVDLTWGLNDVSFLLPIRESSSLDLLLRPDDKGALGDLLPRKIYDRVGHLHFSEEPAITYDRLRVVAIRIDPCFKAGDDFRSCRAMIRFVWQPVLASTGSVTTMDAALHSFYDLTPSEFDLFARELVRIRSESSTKLSTSKAPLAVHPVMSSEGLRGHFYSRLKTLILRYTGTKALTRMTFMRLNKEGQVWDFGGFNIEGGMPLRILIPRLGKPRQIFLNRAKDGEKEFVSSQLAPVPNEARNVNWIIQDSSAVRASAKDSLVIDNVISARELENPRIAMTDATDCVSCHVAQPSRIWATRSFPKLELENRYQEAVYTSETHSLMNTSPSAADTKSLRGFGYFGSEPAISGRTIHESAEVADAMNRAYRTIR